MEYPALRALTAEWSPLLRGALIADAYSQDRDELSLTLDAPAGASTLRVRCAPAQPLIWRADSAGRARRNTASVLDGTVGRRIAGVRVAVRDRHVFIDLEGAGALQMLLFGSRPNVLLVDAAGVVAESFLRNAEWRGQAAPAPRPAPWPDTPDALRERWRSDRTMAAALAGAVPTLGRAHAAEAVGRAGAAPDDPADRWADWGGLLRGVTVVEEQIAERPLPHVYSAGRIPQAISLLRLSDPPGGWEGREHASVDAAARTWAVMNLAVERFLERYRPLESALSAAARRLAESAGAMAVEIQRPSRADRHEHLAHLLMAQPDGRRSGLARLVVPDVISGAGADVEIVLDPALSLYENAERLYSRARQARGARDHAASRHEAIASEAARASALVDELRGFERAGSARDLEAWQGANRDEIGRFVRAGAGAAERLPYTRFDLPGGWEARVGRSARDNAELLAKHSSPHDLWLHARGVAGSHVVLRRPARGAAPPAPVVEAAAALAAWHSKARTQDLVPVSVTERKYVRPVKGGPPGLVRLDREEVVLVRPGKV